MIPKAAIDLIKKFEGYHDKLPDGRAQAYADPIWGWDVPTIGFGTTRYSDGRVVCQGDVVNPDKAEEYLVWEIEQLCKPRLEKIPTWGQMNDNQRSALYSFAYNLGPNFYKGANFTSITRVCDLPERWGDHKWIETQFAKYRNPGTGAEAGLRRRREAEATLFSQDIEPVASQGDDQIELTVKATTTTVLKAKLLDSSDLSCLEKFAFIEGQELLLESYAPASGQHLCLHLEEPITSLGGRILQRVYVYEPHIKIKGGMDQSILLDVPYFSQLNNDTSIFGSGSRQCCTTANAMLADYLLDSELTRKAQEQGLQEPESAYIPMVARYGDTTDHGAQTEALKDLGIESYWSYNLSAEDLLASLQAGVPIVIGVAYRSSGHIIVVRGYDPATNVWIMNDPFGIRHGSSDSYDVGANGAGDPYSNETMQRIFWDLGQEAGWGRIVTSVREEPTGLSVGL